jgi:hypothetical protein
VGSLASFKAVVIEPPQPAGAGLKVLDRGGA